MSGITGASPTNITGAHIPPTVGKEVKEKEPLLSPHSSSLSSLSSGSPLTPAPLILPDIHADFSSGFERLREEAMFTDGPHAIAFTVASVASDLANFNEIWVNTSFNCFIDAHPLSYPHCPCPWGLFHKVLPRPPPHSQPLLQLT